MHNSRSHSEKRKTHVPTPTPPSSHSPLPVQTSPTMVSTQVDSVANAASLDVPAGMCLSDALLILPIHKELENPPSGSHFQFQNPHHLHSLRHHNLRVKSCFQLHLQDFNLHCDNPISLGSSLKNSPTGNHVTTSTIHNNTHNPDINIVKKGNFVRYTRSGAIDILRGGGISGTGVGAAISFSF